MILWMDSDSKDYTFLVRSVMNENDDCLCLVSSNEKCQRENSVSMCECLVLLKNNEEVIPGGKTYFLHALIPNEYQVFYYNEDCAVVKSKCGIAGYIYYSEPKYERYVDRVEWINEDGLLWRIDYYSNHKYRYYSEDYAVGENGQRIITHKKWYCSNGDEKLAWSNHAGNYFEYGNGCITNTIPDFSKIETKVLEAIGTQQKICVTSVEQLKILINSGKNDFSNVYCEVQDLNELQRVREIKNIYNFTPNVDIYVSDNWDPGDLLVGERKIKYQSKRKSHSKIRGGAMIMTTTEDVVEIEKLVSDFKDITFYIAANTMVSPRLAVLDMLENVHVIPGLAEVDLEYYLNKCDYFLDITHGDEIYNCCTKALMDGLLIMGYEDTVRKKVYINKDFLFGPWDYNALKTALRECIDSPECYWAGLNKQAMVQ